MMRICLTGNDTIGFPQLGLHADIGACRSPTTSTQREVSNAGAVVLAWARPL